MPAWLCLAIGLLAMAVRFAILPVRPIPQPAVQDEFSYLLAAETFCFGRVTNPPPAMWVHFETFHELLQPTYTSKYPPAQALFLALGSKLFGDPWYGVWLSCGLMCAALCWMLQGWLPPRYALLGGFMAVAEWGVAGNWVNSYMGGAVAAAAGALVIGAVPRIARRPSPGVAALAALGAVVLANSRPYEGLLLTAGSAIVLLAWRYRRRRPLLELLSWRVLVPAGVILSCGLAAILYYNYRITAHPLLMPYALYQSQYGASPIFWVLPPGSPPIYRHEVLRRFWEDWDRPYYRLARQAPLRLLIQFAYTLLYFLTPVSALALFTAIFLRWGRKVRFVLSIAGVVTAGILLERFSTPHYFAPAAGLVLLLVMLGVQFLRVKFGKHALTGFTILFFAAAAIQASRLTADEYPHQVFIAHRQNVIRGLESKGARHLVLVRYAPDHNVLEEWVYNHADIDRSAIVWARDMGDAANRELLDYYRGREIWLVDADAPNPQPVPYSPR